MLELLAGTQRPFSLVRYIGENHYKPFLSSLLSTQATLSMASPGVEREGGVAGTKRAVGEAQGGEGSETQGKGKKRLEARGADVAMERQTKQRCPASLTAGASKQQPAKLTIAEVMRFNACPQEPRTQLSAEKKEEVRLRFEAVQGQETCAPVRRETPSYMYDREEELDHEEQAYLRRQED